MIYPEKCKAIIDVTKPPYCADPTGKEDCTKILCGILDDILRPNIEGIELVKQKLHALDDPNAQISLENKKRNGLVNAIFPDAPQPTKIIYFPAGTYLVSDTISYSLENLKNMLRNQPMYELCWQIHFKGESRDSVTIKLCDNAKGFEFGNERPIVSFIRAEGSNLAMTNTFEDITIDCGKGNPGAIGLEFFANNSGKVQNVRIVSSDAQKRGFAGFSICRDIISGGYVKNLEVDGFDYGIRVTPLRNYASFENIELKNQRTAGMYIGDTMTSVRKLHSYNRVPAIKVRGACGQLILLDSVCECPGDDTLIGVWMDLGHLLIRNTHIKGYGFPVVLARDQAVCDRTRTYYDEYATDEAARLFGGTGLTLNLPIEETPEIVWESPEKWVCVDDFGAVPDGVTDSADAIQNAMNSGAATVYFQPGRYYLSKSIHIPKTVKNINFMFCDFAASTEMRAMKDGGAFIIDEYAEDPLFMEDVFTWEEFYGHMRFIEHASTRTLVMSDLHTQAAAQYFNSVPGAKVYMENCAATIGDGDDVGEHKSISCFSFHRQTVWSRNINPERSYEEIVNNGSTLWIMGFKTEGFGTAFKTIGGGSTEVLGGTISMGDSREMPAIINDESSVSVSCITNGYKLDAIFPITVRETQNGETRLLTNDMLPIRFFRFYRIPAYVGRKK